MRKALKKKTRNVANLTLIKSELPNDQQTPRYGNMIILDIEKLWETK
jgi:hypothetical protein